MLLSVFQASPHPAVSTTVPELVSSSLPAPLVTDLLIILFSFKMVLFRIEVSDLMSFILEPVSAQ